MGVQMTTMQVCAPFSGAGGYEQVNGNPCSDVTLVTEGYGS